MDLSQNFYILALAPNAARLSVRFFYVNSFGSILKNIAEHYERLSIVKPVREEQDYLGIRDMLNETVNQKSKNKTPISNMSALVLQAILSGNRYPASLIYGSVNSYPCRKWSYQLETGSNDQSNSNKKLRLDEMRRTYGNLMKTAMWRLCAGKTIFCTGSHTERCESSDY